jgi:hypothetical protein
MSTFIPDTNIWIEVGRDAASTSRFENAIKRGDSFVVAPPALIELVRGLVRSGGKYFGEDRKTYTWMMSNHCQVLELPRVFMANILHTTTPNSGVRPEHYAQLIQMVANAEDFSEFVAKCDGVGSVWKNIDNLDGIHEAELEKELRSLEDLARRRRPIDLAGTLARTFGAPGCRPVPVRVQRSFSAAIEYLECSIQKVAMGANPRKNDRGMYVDWQLLNYLANPNFQSLTEEDFSGEISKSPQRERIVSLQILN